MEHLCRILLIKMQYKGANVSSMLLAYGILMLISVISVVLALYYIIRSETHRRRIRVLEQNLREFTSKSDVDAVTKLIESNSKLIPRISQDVKRSVADLLFNTGRFDAFIRFCDIAKLDDARLKLLRGGYPILALDIETVHEYEKYAREIGLVFYNGLDLIGLRIKPDVFEKRYGDLSEFLRSLFERAGVKIIVGHNVYFHDRDILVSSHGLNFLNNYKYVDTLVLATIALPEFESRELESLAKLYEIEYRAHDPVEDARASIMVLRKLLGELDTIGVLDVLQKIKYDPILGLSDILQFVELDKERLVKHVKARGVSVIEYGKLVCEIDLVVDESRIDCTLWSPRALPELKLDEVYKHIDDPRRAVAYLILYSYRKSGRADPRPLLTSLALVQEDEELGKALQELVQIYAEKSSVPKEGKICVSYSDLSELAREVARENVRISKLVFKRFSSLLLLPNFPDILKSIHALLKHADDVEIPVSSSLVSKLTGVEVSESKTIDIHYVPDTVKVSSRHVDLIASALLEIASRWGPSIVLLSNKFEEKLVNAVKEVAGSELEDIVQPLQLDEITLGKLRQAAARGAKSIIVLSLDSLLRKFTSKLPVKLDQRESLNLLFDAISSIIDYKGPIIILRSKLDFEKYLHSNVKVSEEKVKLDSIIEVPLHPAPLFETCENALKLVEDTVGHYWGFRLRPYQRRAVLYMLQPYVEKYLLKKPLTVIILPTGAGKSVIFQSIAVTLNKVNRGVMLVISPLRALIEDQVRSLQRRGISVRRIDGTIELSERLRVIEEAKRGLVSIIYITPEQLMNELIREALLRNCEINYVVFDEAHCVVKWGRTFRPAYKYVATQVFRQLLSKGFWIPIACLTATIPEAGLRELVESLIGSTDMEVRVLDLSQDVSPEDEIRPSKPIVLKGPVLRQNLILEKPIYVKDGLSEDRVRALAQTIARLRQWADQISQGRTWIGIIFTGFVKSSYQILNAEYIARKLQGLIGEEVVVYHAQLPERKREEILNILYQVAQGQRRTPRIVICTKAFGMGVDLPNIRWVVHYMLSDSLEDYYQEVGRGGRDGLPFKAQLIYSPIDSKIKVRQAKESGINPTVATYLYRTLRRLQRLFPHLNIVPTALLIAAALDLLERAEARRISKLREKGKETRKLTVKDLIEQAKIQTQKFMQLLAEEYGTSYEVTKHRLCVETGYAYSALPVGSLPDGKSVYVIERAELSPCKRLITCVLSKTISINELNMLPHYIKENVVVPIYSENRTKTLFIYYNSQENLRDIIKTIETTLRVRVLPIEELHIGSLTETFEIYDLKLPPNERDLKFRASKRNMAEVRGVVVLDKLMRKLVQCSPEEVNELFKNEVERYFSIGSEKYTEELVRGILEELAQKYYECNIVLPLVEYLSSNETAEYDARKHIREIEDRTKRKEMISRLVALTMIAASMMHSIDLSSILVVVPYGYKTHIKEMLDKIVNEMDLPLVTDDVNIYAVKDDESVKKLQENTQFEDYGIGIVVLHSGQRVLLDKVVNLVKKRCARTLIYLI